MKKLFYRYVLIMSIISCQFISTLIKAQTAPSLGNILDYGILSGDTITLNDSAMVVGKAGATQSITGNIRASSGVYANGSGNVSAALTDLLSAISYCSGLTGNAITGQTLNAGIYQVSGNLELYGSLNLQGDTSSVFIFNVSDSLICGSNFSLNLIGVNPKNIYFNVGKSLVINSNVNLSGVFFISENTQAELGFIGEHALLCLHNIYLSGKSEFQSVQNLLSGFTQVYFGSSCGLTYTQASVQLNKRTEIGTISGTSQPAPLTITVPSGVNLASVHAYLFYDLVSVGPPPTNYSVIITSPNSTTASYTPVQAAFDPNQSICWNVFPYNFNYTTSYCIDVSASIIAGTGSPQTYLLSGIPTYSISTPSADPNGATLFIIYKDPTLHNNGTIMLGKGLDVYEGFYNGGIDYITNALFGPNVPTVQSQSNAFFITADVETNIDISTGLYQINNAKVGINIPPQAQMWQFVSRNLLFNAPSPQNDFVLYGSYNNGYDCHAMIALGAYYQTQTSDCNSYQCAGADQYICPGPGQSASLTACSGMTSYLWSPSTGLSCTACANPTATPNSTTTYTLTVQPGNVTDYVTVFVNNAVSPPILVGPPDGCESGIINVSPVNSNYVYTWTSTIGGISGGTINGMGTHYDPSPYSPANGGTVTFIATDPTTGCTAQTSVIIAPCCEGLNNFPDLNYISDIYNTTYSSYWHLFAPYTGTSVSTPLILDPSVSGNIHLKVTVQIIADVDLTIANADLVLLYQAHIDVLPNKTLRINNTVVENCNSMWNRIDLQPHSHLIIENNSHIKGGLNAVYAEGGSDFSISDSYFDKNYIAIHAEQGNFSTSSIKNTNFTCQGLNQLAYPHLNEHTLYQIELINVANGSLNGITIGNSSQASYQNYFADADVGIYSSQSNFTAVNNIFDNFLIRPCTNTSNYTCPPLGFAIYAKGDKNYATSNLAFKAVIGTNVTNGGNTFKNSTNGAYLASNYDLSAYKNNFTNMLFGTGINGTWLADASGVNRIIDIRNNHFNGFGVSSSPSGTGTLISDFKKSNITIKNNYYNNLPNYSGTYGVSLVNKSVLSPIDWNTTFVQTNNIKNCYRKGISLLNYSNAKINTTNTITMSTAVPAALQYGIQVSSGGANNIESNTIQRIGNDPNNSYLNLEFGVSVETSTPNTITSNSLYRMGAGMRFIGANNINTLTCNYIYHNYNGIQLDGTYIGNQGSSSASQDNVWYESPNNLTNADIIQYGSPNNNLYQFFTISQSPPYKPLNQYLLPLASYYTFPLANPQTGCAVPCDPPCAQQRMVDVVNSQGIYGLMTDDEKYAAIKNVFLQLIQEPDLMNLGNDNDKILQDFYNQAQGTPLGQLIAADTLMKSDTSAVRIIISNLDPDNNAQANLKAVLTIYLVTIASYNEDYTDDQFTTLYNIAVQSPLTGGDAVYIARAMINLDVDDLVSEDGRYAQTVVQPNNKPGIMQKLNSDYKDKLYPNPANQIVNYDSRLAENSTGDISVNDLLGNLISKHTLHSGINNLELQTGNLLSGLYVLKINIDGRLVKTRKLIINH